MVCVRILPPSASCFCFIGKESQKSREGVLSEKHLCQLIVDDEPSCGTWWDEVNDMVWQFTVDLKYIVIDALSPY